MQALTGILRKGMDFNEFICSARYNNMIKRGELKRQYSAMRKEIDTKEAKHKYVHREHRKQLHIFTVPL